MTTNKDFKLFDTNMAASSQESLGGNARSRQEKEEKLILTAWKSMSFALQQHSLCDDSGAAAQSFLAKQRQLFCQVRRALPLQLQPR